MNNKLKKLIPKLKKKFPHYDISFKNFMSPEVEEIGDKLIKTYHTVANITIFSDPKEGEGSRILIKVDGFGEGISKSTAAESAIIHAINQLGIF